MPEEKIRRRWWLACLVLLVLSCCCLSVAAGGGYFAIKAGSLSAMQLSAMAQGVGEVHIANLDDYRLTVAADQLDAAEGEYSFDDLTLEPFDIGSFGGMAQGRYQISFVSDANPTTTLSCTIRINRGDAYHFVTVPEGIAVSLEGGTAQNATEVDASTSSLCNQ